MSPDQPQSTPKPRARLLVLGSIKRIPGDSAQDIFREGPLTEQASSLEVQEQESCFGKGEKGRKGDDASSIERAALSQFTYRKLSVLEQQILLVLLVHMFLNYLLAQAEDVPRLEREEQIMLAVMTVLNCWLGRSPLNIVVLLLIRRAVAAQLLIDQKLEYPYSSPYLSPALAVLTRKEHLLPLLLEVLLAFLHPNLLLREQEFFIHDEFYSLTLRYSLNNLVGVLSLCKFYLVFRSMVTLTRWATPRVRRVCSLNQVVSGVFYSVKCIQKEHPIKSIIVSVSIIITLFSYGFRVTEGKVSSRNSLQPNGFEQIHNCLWFTLTTMYTLGYGDYTLITPPARILAGLLSVLGVITNSFLLVTLSEYLSTNNSEAKALKVLHRIGIRDLMRSHGAQALQNYIEANQMLKTGLDEGSKIPLEELFDGIRVRADEIKGLRLALKNLELSNDVNQVMLYNFLQLRHNLQEVCRRQLQIQHLLEKGPRQSSEALKSPDPPLAFFMKQTFRTTPVLVRPREKTA